MSGLQKIVLASTLVVVGYGVARFLGQPALVKSVSSPTPQAESPAVIEKVVAPPARSNVVNGARLVPDHKGSQTSPSLTAGAMPDVPMLGTRLESIMPVSSEMEAAVLPRTIESVPIVSAPIQNETAPRARLRDEAPRAIGIDPRSPVAIRRTPPVDEEMRASCQIADNRSAPTTWPEPQALHASYNADAQNAPSAVATSYNETANSTAAQIGPPPWPAPEENAEPRTHVVVDGDSLERIASRYLSDPQRSREIFELNRGVLTNPELLPIGAELKIPERIASAKSGARTWQPNSSAAKPGGESISSNLVPLRPASSQGESFRERNLPDP